MGSVSDAMIGKYHACFRRGPLTEEELAVQMKCGIRSARMYITRLRELGLVHLGAWKEDTRSGRRIMLAQFFDGQGEEPARPDPNGCIARRKKKKALEAERERLRNIAFDLPIKSVWLQWERQALKEGRHAVLPGQDILFRELCDDDMRHAPHQRSTDDRTARVVGRYEQGLFAVQPGIGGT